MSRSVEITNPDRAGRAPYNFVPPAETSPVIDPPKDGDRYHADRVSGEIELTLTALTDFYVRGMLPLDQYRNGKEVKEQSAPFGVASQLRIPGSSIRGAVRTLVEILGKAPLDPVDDARYAYRAVAASPKSDSDAFEPFAKRYHDILWDNGQAGYMKRNAANKLEITPARRENGHQFYKVDWRDPNLFAQTVHTDGTAICIGSDEGARKFLIGKMSTVRSRVDVTNSPDLGRLTNLVARLGRVPCFIDRGNGSYRVLLDPSSAEGTVEGIYLAQQREIYYCNSAEPLSPTAPIRKLDYFRCKLFFDPSSLAVIPRQNVLKVTSWTLIPQGSCTQAGWIVCSGRFQGKHYEWILNRPGDGAFGVDDVAQKWHNEAGLLEWLKDPEQRRWMELPTGLPCFYALAKEPDKPQVYFGATRYFRVPYAGTVAQANPRPGSSPNPNLAEAIFGRRKQRSQAIPSWRGRVFFEDAFHIEGKPEIEECKIVLGSPQPTTFQHYIEQVNESQALSTHWEARPQNGRALRPALRGNKLYWHQPNPLPLPQWESIAEGIKSTVRRVRPPKEGHLRFRARIRFENLSKVELGALLTALQLPWDGQHKMAHKIGMGKPLGWGSFRLEARLLLLSIEQRYAEFFHETSDELSVGLTDTKVDDYLDAFAAWYHPTLDRNSLWSHDERMQDLEALLEFGKLKTIRDWPHRIRYLAFGNVAGNQYNEYQKIGGPAHPRPALRRPLPPAAQVFRVRALPSDPNPF